VTTRVPHADDERSAGSLTTPAFWKAFFRDGGEHAPFAFFDEVAVHLPKGPGLSFLEIGVGPGRILGEFCGRLGYEAHGIDYAFDPVPVRRWLEGLGVKVGDLRQADAFEWSPTQKYDVVASFGFIEHFENLEKAVDVHFSMVKPRGVVVITLPNLARGQWLLHWLYNRANLRIHNVACMNLRFFRRAAERNGAKLLCARYTGGRFAFWPEAPLPQEGIKAFVMWRILGLCSRVARFLPARNSAFSPYLITAFEAPAEGEASS
jgi:SAM-dependent methyltransferase